jgi:hypothetical protein
MPIYFGASISVIKTEDDQVTANKTAVTHTNIMRMPTHFITVWICVKFVYLLFESHSIGKERDKFSW